MKQVIIIRKDLNMRKGKMVSSGCHASIASYLKTSKEILDLWEQDNSRKICVSCDSENELISLYEKAFELKLPCSIITDIGLTEFNGISTKTAVAIGPAEDDVVNKITGHLKLL